jgi:putative membrane protein
MTLEAILAYLHLLAILTLVVFISSEAALCRAEWMNAAVVERLVKVDSVYGAAAIAVLATGAARTWWGIKGAAWYWTNPLLHIKLALVVVVAVLSIFPTLTYLRWRKALRTSGALPPATEVSKTRTLVMIEAHLIALIPLVAVFFARGFSLRM